LVERISYRETVLEIEDEEVVPGAAVIAALGGYLVGDLEV
jgi:hypothetical protein